MERDRVEVEDTKRRVPEPMRQYYVQMAVGRRSECLSPATLEAAARRPAVTATSRSVAAWRHMKVLHAPPPPTPSFLAFFHRSSPRGTRPTPPHGARQPFCKFCSLVMAMGFILEYCSFLLD